MDEKESIALEATKYELLDSLMQHDGWPILLKHLERVRTVIMEALLVEEDHKKIMNLQARHRAFNSVITTLQSAKSIKENLYANLNDILEDEKLKEEFDL